MTKEELHQFRKQIDACILKTEKLDHFSYKREMGIVKIKLQEAKMWVGKCLEELGSELPEEFRDKAE
jgi:hypothetical protein